MLIEINDSHIHIGSHAEPITRKDWRELTADVYEVPTEYRQSGYFIGYYAFDEPREIPACSTYTYVGSVTIPANDEALLERSKQDAIERINDNYIRSVAVLEADYPQPERESWHVQTDEARRLLNDQSAHTPWIDAAAQGRGVTREELALLIAEQDSQYRAIHGTLTGKRQALRGRVMAAESVEELSIIVSAIE